MYIYMNVNDDCNTQTVLICVSFLIANINYPVLYTIQQVNSKKTSFYSYSTCHNIVLFYNYVSITNVYVYFVDDYDIHLMGFL